MRTVKFNKTNNNNKIFLVVVVQVVVQVALTLSTRSIGIVVDAFTFVPTTTTTTTKTTVATTTTALFATTTNKDKDGGQIKKKIQILVCGGGIGGLSTAYDARHLIPDADITVVADREQFQFTPSNPWVAVHKRTVKDVSLSLTEILPKHNIKFRHAKARKLHPHKNELVLDDGTHLSYDYLVIATGPRLAFDEIPGARHEHSHTASVCTTPHALHAAETFDKLVEHPGPVVVGATQGASCFGPAYEYAMLIQHELQKRGGKKLVDACPIHFVTSEPYIGHLGLKGAGDSQKILTDMLEERNIQYTTNCSVKRVHRDSVSIHYFDENGYVINKDLPTRLTMLIPPFRGLDLWKTIPGLTDDYGMILVDKHQQTMAYPNIFGVGVCVHIDPLEHTKVPTGVPKTGYMIESQGTAAVKNIRDMSQEGGCSKPLHHVPLNNGLCITDFGKYGAVFVAMPQIPPRKHDYTITGKIGTLAKIAFEKYFLHKIETGDTDPYYEKYMLALVGIQRTKEE